MKRFQFVSMSILSASLLLSCNSNSDDNNNPNPTGTKPNIIGYFTNWSIYGGGDNYSAKAIPAQVDEIAYAFAQIGNCSLGTVDTAHPTGYANETDPKTCLKSDPKFQSGIQDYKLHSTDLYSDFSTQPDGSKGKGTIGQVLNSNKKVLLSIGGWSLSAALRDAIAQDNVKGFVSSIIDFIDPTKPLASDYGNKTIPKDDWNGKKFHGIDIDWEPNANMWTLASSDPNLYKSVSLEDLDNYKNFLSALKSSLNEAKKNGLVEDSILRIAITANPAALKDIDNIYKKAYPNAKSYLVQIADIVDSIDLMTYDYHGFAGEKCAGFNSALFNDVNADKHAQCNFDPNFSIEGSVGMLNHLGVPYNKIIIGVPTYGRGYKMAPSNSVVISNNSYMPYQPVVGIYNSPMTDAGNAIVNRTIYTGLIPTITDYSLNFIPNFNFDAANGQNFAWAKDSKATDANNIVFVNFDDANSAANKMKYAVKLGLQSVMVWSLESDVRPTDTKAADGSAIDYTKASVVYGLDQGRH